MSPPVRPLLTKTTLSLPPDTASRAFDNERIGVGFPIPNSAGGMNKLRAKDLVNSLEDPGFELVTDRIDYHKYVQESYENDGQDKSPD